jgi:dTDP-4-dehydrorhamnose reductase
MDILVTGGSGTVGWKILDRAEPQDSLWYTYKDSDVDHPEATGRKLDIREKEDVTEVVSEIKPDAVVHSAAMTDVDGCETNPEKARAVNVEGTRNVVNAASSVGAHLVFISTSFVFDGTKHPHEEDDKKNPVNEYGRTKALAEEVVEQADIQSAIVRTDQPYGWTEPWQNETMVEWILDELDEDGDVEVFDDWYNVPTYLPDLAEAILEITKTGKEGIYHAVGPDYLNRYEWACKIADVFGHDASRIEPIPSETVDLPAERPNAYIRNGSVIEAIGYEFVSVRSGLERMNSER